MKHERICRSTKISNALKKNFIDSVVRQGLNIKKAAVKHKLNYSTAKVIYQKYRLEQPRKHISRRNISENEEEASMKKVDETPQVSKTRCSYREYSFEENQETGSNGEQMKKHKMQIFSTVAWDFLKDGVPSLL